MVSEREGGLEQLRVIDLASQAAHTITFPEPSYTVSLDNNPEFETSVIRYRYQSQITPASVYDYDMNTQARTLLKQTPVLGGYDPSQYVAERLSAAASDGTRIPISMVYKKGLEKNGEAPLLLYGYGSYGISMPAQFSSNRLSLLERGVVFAVAHIRGGGEMGEDWRDAGKLHLKRNTFTDFIACAEFLVAEKYTSPAHLAIQGGSAGGLLMGAAINLRPELFHAVLSQVPFVDVLNTMLDDTLPLTRRQPERRTTSILHQLGMGQPERQSTARLTKTNMTAVRICGLTAPARRGLHQTVGLSFFVPASHHYKCRKSYPAMLVKTSLNDSQVFWMYWEAAKLPPPVCAMPEGSSRPTRTRCCSRPTWVLPATADPGKRQAV